MNTSSSNGLDILAHIACDKLNNMNKSTNIVDEVLAKAFNKPTQYTKKDIPLIINKPNIVIYTKNDLVNTILINTFISPLEYNKYK